MFGFALVAVPLAAYLAAALSVRRKDLRSPDDFFIAYRKADVTTFSTSSIAYAFQMSTIYPFLVWGASNFYFVPIVNTVCWGIGILLFYLSSNRYKGFIGSDQTLHGFLGGQYGHTIRTLASYLTIIGFLGFAVAELYFGSRVILSITDSKATVYFCIVGVSVLVYAYIAYGGQPSSLRTDQLQLGISYLGFFGLIIYFLSIILKSGHSSLGLRAGVIVALLYVPLILFYRRGTFLRISFGGKSGAAVGRSLNLIISVLLAVIWVLLLMILPRQYSPSAASRFFDITGFGYSGLFSLILLPLCWQFVDLTNWQRLLSVRPTAMSERALQKDIGRGLLVYAVESPFTWLVSLFFGLLVTQAITGINATNLLVDLPHHLLNSPNITDRAFAYVFILSVMSIMLSTVDSFMVGIIYTFAYDSFPATQRILDSHKEDAIEKQADQIINAGRLFGLVTLALALGLLFFFDSHLPNGGDLFVNLLLAFYSAQLSFFPLVFGVLFLRVRSSPGWAMASMLLGAGVGIGLGVYAVIWNPAYAWYPLPACFGLSCLVYMAGCVVAARPASRSVAS